MSETYDLFQLGRSHLRSGRPAQATVSLEKAKRAEPTSRSIREALGIAYFRIGRWQEAEAEFRVLVELDPSDEFAHYALGRALVNQGRREEATPHIKLGRALRPRTPPTATRSSSACAPSCSASGARRSPSTARSSRRSARASSCSSASRGGHHGGGRVGLAGKVARLRIFENEDGRLDRSLLDVAGRRSSSASSPSSPTAREGHSTELHERGAAGRGRGPLYQTFCAALEAEGVRVAQGVFGARMAGRSRQRRSGHDRARRLSDRIRLRARARRSRAPRDVERVSRGRRTCGRPPSRSSSPCVFTPLACRRGTEARRLGSWRRQPSRPYVWLLTSAYQRRLSLAIRSRAARRRCSSCRATCGRAFGLARRSASPGRSCASSETPAAMSIAAASPCSLAIGVTIASYTLYRRRGNRACGAAPVPRPRARAVSSRPARRPARRRRAEVRAAFGCAPVARGGLRLAAYGRALAALELAPAAAVAAVRETGIRFAVALTARDGAPRAGQRRSTRRARSVGRVALVAPG